MPLIDLTQEQVEWLQNHLEEEMVSLKEEAAVEASDDLNDVAAGEVALVEGMLNALGDA